MKMPYVECFLKLPDDLKELGIKCCKNTTYAEKRCHRMYSKDIDFDHMCHHPESAAEPFNCFDEEMKKDMTKLDDAIPYKQCQLELLKEYCDLPFDLSKKELTCKAHETFEEETSTEVEATTKHEEMDRDKKKEENEQENTESTEMTTSEITTLKITQNREMEEIEKAILCWRHNRSSHWHCRIWGSEELTHKSFIFNKKEVLNPKTKFHGERKRVSRPKLFIRHKPKRIWKVKKDGKPDKQPRFKFLIVEPRRIWKVKKSGKPDKQSRPKFYDRLPKRLTHESLISNKVSSPNDKLLWKRKQIWNIKKGDKSYKPRSKYHDKLKSRRIWKVKKDGKPDKQLGLGKCQRKMIKEFYCKGVKRRKIICLSRR